MKLNAYNMRYFQADNWTVSNRQDEDTGGFVPIFGYAKTIKCTLSFDQSFVFGSLTTPDVLPLGSQLRGITDRNGDPVIGVDYAYSVEQVAPVVNALGYAEEYVYKVKRVALG